MLIMHINKYCLLTAIFIIGCFYQCKKDPYLPKTRSFNEDFTLKPGQKAYLVTPGAPDTLVVHFVDVVCDGRCSKDVYCFLYGSVDILMEFQQRKRNESSATVKVMMGFPSHPKKIGWQTTYNRYILDEYDTMMNVSHYTVDTLDYIIQLKNVDLWPSKEQHMVDCKYNYVLKNYQPQPKWQRERRLNKYYNSTFQIIKN